MSTGKAQQTENRLVVGCLSVLLPLFALRQWLMPLSSSLWADETGTVWLIKGGPTDVLRRCLDWPGQSCVYAFFISGITALAGASELTLRLPSVLATAGATFLLYKIGARLVDSETGLLAALTLNLLPTLRFQSVDARPHALGLLVLLGATLVLLDWLDEGGAILGIVYALLSSLTVHLHYLLAAAFIAHALYACRRIRGGAAVGWGAWLASVSCALFLTSPLFGSFRLLAKRGASLSFAPPPPPTLLWEALTPPVLVSGLLLGALAAWFYVPCLRFEAKSISRDTVIFLVAWGLILPCLLYSFSVLTSANIFIPRYLISSAPPIALGFAWLVRGMQPLGARGSVAVMLTVVGCLTAAGQQLWPIHGGQEWRGAMTTVRSIVRGKGTPVLIQSPFIESADPRLQDQLTPEGYLMAVLAAYPAAGQVVPLPIKLGGPNATFAGSIARNVLTATQEFLVVTSDIGGFHLAFDGFLMALGYDVAPALSRSFPGIQVVVFRRRPA